MSTKRQNFNVDPEQEAELEAAREALNAPTIKDTVLRCARIANVLARELRDGKTLYAIDAGGEKTRVVISELEHATQQWKYLSERPHAWRRQLWIKGMRMMASTLWLDMLANKRTPQEAAEDRDLPLDLVLEVIRYCEKNKDLIRLESAEDRRLQLLEESKRSA